MDFYLSKIYVTYKIFSISYADPLSITPPTHPESGLHSSEKGKQMYGILSTQKYLNLVSIRGKKEDTGEISRPSETRLEYIVIEALYIRVKVLNICPFFY